jgi:arginine utilization protein RocB
MAKESKKSKKATVISLGQTQAHQKTTVTLDEFLAKAAEFSDTDQNKNPETCVARVSSLESLSGSRKPLAIRRDDDSTQGEEEETCTSTAEVTQLKPRDI